MIVTIVMHLLASLLLLIPFIVARPCCAQQAQSIKIAGRELRTGMSVSKVVEQLGGTMRLQAGSDNRWIVVATDTGEARAELTFDADKLVKVTHNLGTYQGENAAQVGQALSELLVKNIGKEVSLTAKTLHISSPQRLTVDRFDIDGEDRGISISFNRGELNDLNLANRVVITEHIRAGKLVRFGKTLLSFGMARAQAKKELAARYLLVEPDEKVCLIYSMESEDYIGIAYFAEGRLAGVSKIVGELYHDTAYQLSNTIFSAVRWANEQDEEIAAVKLIQPKQNKQPRAIRLEFEQSAITLTVNEAANYQIQIAAEIWQ